MSSETAEVDYLQELSSRHDEVVAKLDELEKKITLVLDEYLEKVQAITDEALTNEDLEIK